MCWFLILSVGKKRKQAVWWQKIVTFAPPPKLFCLYNHTPLFFCFQLCFTQILAGVSRKSEIADPFYWAADAAFFSFSLATKKETKMAARFYVNNFTIRFFFSHPLHTYIPTYLLTYLHTYILTYLLTYLHTYIHKGWLKKNLMVKLFT